MSKFEVWEAHQEQWDANDIDPPDQIALDVQDIARTLAP
jgi:hypothetical protein